MKDTDTRIFHQCTNGHYYEGSFCEFCPTQFSGVTIPDEIVACGIPICRNCSCNLRKEISIPKYIFVGSIYGDAYDGKVPWNYDWNGTCESCGYDYNISMRQNIVTFEFGHDKKTTVKIKDCSILLSRTQPTSICLSGVEIESRIGIGESHKIFISTNELKYLIRVLTDSPILKQLDSMQSCY